MMHKEIIQYPNKILRTLSTDIVKTDDYLKLIQDLKDSLEMSKKDGVGLSAPQIGINKRVYIVKKVTLENKKEKFTTIALINPVIIKKSKEQVESLEGCLSINDKYGYVSRYKNVKVKYLDQDLNHRVISTGGYLSMVLQHEQDHLDGILFTDKVLNKKVYTEEEIDKKLAQERTKN